jgi:hypothetical protein
MDLWRRAGLPYSRAESVVLVFQGRSTPYAAVEPIESRYLERHFGDSSGNLYRGQRTADLSYLGESQALYADRYRSTRTPGARLDRRRRADAGVRALFGRGVSGGRAEHIDVEEWIRWFAVSTVLGTRRRGSTETRGTTTTCTAPRRKIRPLAWDMDSTFQEPEEPIFRPSLPAFAGSSRTLVRAALFSCPRDLSRALVHSRAIARQASRIQAFGDDTIDDLVTYTRSRSAFVRRSVPIELSCSVVSAVGDRRP